MRKSSYIVLKSILNTSQSFERLAPFLDDGHLNKLTSLDAPKSFSYKHFLSENIFNHVHYSWLIPTLKNLKEDLSFCITSLPEKMRAKLNIQFGIEPYPTEITANAKEYIHLIFLNSLLGEEDTILPIQYLEHSPINILASKTKEDLIQVIDYLALFDLVKEIRKILNTNTIKKIYSFLTDDEKKFLTKTQSLNDPVSFSSLLEKWDGTKESFRKILHKKGLYRFGLALCGSHSDLVWYICHLLDIGRGASLMKMCEKKVNPVISDTIQSHILKILDILKA